MMLRTISGAAVGTAIAALLLVPLSHCGVATQAQWSIVVPDRYSGEEAIRVAVSDLQGTAAAHGVLVVTEGEADPTHANAIIVGGPECNAVTQRLERDGALALDVMEHPEGFQIVTAESSQGRVIVVSGGSVMGDVYGLYWIRDRIRAAGHIPEINVIRNPALDIRYTRIQVRSEEDIRTAQRYGLNLVFGDNPLRLIPWNAEPENSENVAHRERTRELAAYAHSMHMKFLAFGTDFTYHPSLLEEFGATLTPADPRFWDAVQAKYRRLLEAVPELDGVGTFTADEQSFWGNYKTFDIAHGGEECDWSLEKRYRTFVQKVWDVVVGEHDKIVMNRTWATNMYEQQAQPDVYRRIFTDEVPTRNLYLIPSFTQNDRWWFQAYNPTINQTPHHTMVVCETMDYHAAGNGFFPTYPGAYFQAGLEGMLDVEDSNLKGLSLDVPGSEDWHTRSLTAYTVSRLAWDYKEDIKEIAKDFAAIHFGPAAAEGMGELLMLSPVAYKYGLYIQPATYGQFNSLPHIRVGQFVAQGYSRIDGGREHIEFLRTIFLRCKPWIPETLMYLDHGLDTADRMKEEFAAVRSSLDPDAADEVARALDLTYRLIQTNNRYVKAIFAYFEYRECPDSRHRQALEAAYLALRESRSQFAQAPGFGFQLYGVDQLLLNAELALSDLAMAESMLANALTPEGIKQTVAEEQAIYAEALEGAADRKTLILHWRGKIDGSDIVRMRGDEVSIEHLRWDGPTVERSEVLAPLPDQAGTVVIRDLGSRPLHPFVLEQPSDRNDFTVEIYLVDEPGGADWCEFELYFLPQSPAELGLRDTLKARA